MLDQEREKLRAIKTFPSLVKYLRDELNWPIETDDFDELVFDYEAEELGIDPETAVKIDEIKQLRPLVSNQPWGIFFIKFEPKRLPVVVLRRILSRLVFKKRASANKSEHASWNLDDLLFISNYGEDEQRQITFAHFSQDKAIGDLPTLKVLGWDDADTALHLDHCHRELKEKLRWPDDEHNLKDWCEKWSSTFILRHREVITTSKDLASRLADLAKRIRSRANRVLAIETERGQLRKLYKAFQEALIHDLGEDDFADMYAQTIAYGLLAARVSRPMGVTAGNVADMIPITNPFLKEMLGTFLTAGGRKGAIDFDELGVQEVVELLNSPDTHMDAILRDFGNRTQQEDPVIHFYELFLSEYDKKKKVQRGVFFTPQPVVSYIVRSVHEILQSEFGLEDGLAAITTWDEMVKRNPGLNIPEGVSPDEPFVQILDPATGTATFLVEVVDIIYKMMRAKWIKQGHMDLETQGLWNEYVPKHLLPRLYGFELMMAPYAIAHMKLGLKLFETGYTFNTDERVHVYLTNSLEPATDSMPQRVFEQWAPALAHEARAVNTVKQNKRFTIVIGNPPYSVSSVNKSNFIENLMDDYKVEVKDERNIQPISDDYIKFIRFAQHNLEQTSLGVFGYITNNLYLSGIIHRGIRHCLIRAFNKANILNLHGSTRIGEDNPSGERDENVFDIQQGVSISLFTKTTQVRLEECSIVYADIYGPRELKYKYLIDNDINTTSFDKVKYQEPYYFFFPTRGGEETEYNDFWSLTKIFKQRSTGVKTHRDHFAVAVTKEELMASLSIFLGGQSDEFVRNELKLGDTGTWKLSNARRKIKEELKQKNKLDKVRLYAYRPFDVRWIYYNNLLIDRPRREIMQHLTLHNLTLVTTRQLANQQFAHCFIADQIGDICLISLSTKESSYFFPLYVYDFPSRRSLFLNASESNNRYLNINPEFLTSIQRITSIDLAAEQVFNYIYAILNSNIYRKRYKTLLQVDFPRIPLTSNKTLFIELIKKGDSIAALHLMKSPVLEMPITKWQGSRPSSEVEKVTYSDKTVWIDKGQTEGFRGVPENVWDFHIGGYQVCEKWLKDRKGRVLSAEDVTHYQKIVVALNETVRLMKEIDEVIEEHGGWPGAFV